MAIKFNQTHLRFIGHPNTYRLSCSCCRCDHWKYYNCKDKVTRRISIPSKSLYLFLRWHSKPSKWAAISRIVNDENWHSVCTLGDMRNRFVLPLIQSLNTNVCGSWSVILIVSFRCLLCAGARDPREAPVQDTPQDRAIDTLTSLNHLVICLQSFHVVYWASQQLKKDKRKKRSV